MFKNKIAYLYIAIGLAALGLIIYGSMGKGSKTYVEYSPSDKGSYSLDDFASCLDKSGAMFYGTPWCSYCQAQRDLFGDSLALVPYVDCSTPSGVGVNPECTKAGITAYPSWIFGDGNLVMGMKSLEYLSEMTGCNLPS